MQTGIVEAGFLSRRGVRRDKSGSRVGIVYGKIAAVADEVDSRGCKGDGNTGTS